MKFVFMYFFTDMDGEGEIYHVSNKIGAKIQKLNLKTYMPIIKQLRIDKTWDKTSNVHESISSVIKLNQPTTASESEPASNLGLNILLWY